MALIVLVTWKRCIMKGGVKMKRRRMGRGESRRSFSRGARRVHMKNLRAKPMRGGIRL